jgi:hypothetical protein
MWTGGLGYNLMRTAERRVEGIWVSYKEGVAQPSDPTVRWSWKALCYEDS